MAEEEQNCENRTLISFYLIPGWSRVWKTPPITWALRVGCGKGGEGVLQNLHELALFYNFIYFLFWQLHTRNYVRKHKTCDFMDSIA